MAKTQSKGTKAGRAPARTEARPLGGWLTRRRRRRVAWAGVAVGVIVVAGVAGWLYARVWAPPPGDYFPTLGNEHIETAETPHIRYNSDPPTSGPHLPYIAPWGVHSRPIAKELQVHNLEDGGVVVNYKPECEPSVLEPLKTIVGRYKERVLLAPYPGLDRCVALTAWTRLDKFDQVDERRVVRFIEAYRGIDHHKRG
jgi:hypothetical protein